MKNDPNIITELVLRKREERKMMRKLKNKNYERGRIKKKKKKQKQINLNLTNEKEKLKEESNTQSIFFMILKYILGIFEKSVIFLKKKLSFLDVISSKFKKKNKIHDGVEIENLGKKKSAIRSSKIQEIEEIKRILNKKTGFFEYFKININKKFTINI